MMTNFESCITFASAELYIRSCSYQLSLARPFSRLSFQFIIMLASMFARGVKWADVEDDDVC